MKTWSYLDKYNTKIKTYPNGKRVILYANCPIFKPKEDGEDDWDEDFEDEEPEQPDEPAPDTGLPWEDTQDTDTPDEPEEPSEHDILRAQRRAKDRIFDIAFANADLWTHFLTLTIDGHKLDSKNVPEVMQSLNIWLSNMQQRKGLKYLLCPEYHFDGIKVHCHALISGDLTMVDSGTRIVEGFDKPLSFSTIRSKGLTGKIISPVYNVTDWKYGFSTAVPIYGDGAALSTYVTKYITKNCKKIFGKYYWSSKGLVRDVETTYTNTKFGDVDEPMYRIPNCSILLKYKAELTYTKE